MTEISPFPTVACEIYRGQNHRILRTADAQYGPLIIKSCLTDSTGGVFQASLLHEQRILTRLAGLAGCPKTVHLDPAGQWLSYEDIGGVSLQQSGLLGDVALTRFLCVAERLSRIIAAIHGRGVIHKDINPANIIIRLTDLDLQVIDFDLATTFSEERRDFVHPNHLLGVLAYMSPELTGRMNRPVDYRTDLYSLGAVLYALATGEPPFAETDPLRLIHAHLARSPKPPTEQAPWLPPGVSELILTLLAKEPDDRYQSAAGLAYDLHLFRHALEQKEPTAPVRRRAHDMPLSLRPPNRLYGRDEALTTLRQAFDGVTVGGARGIFVAGYSGVGKTSLVHELHKSVALGHGRCLSGKFEQFERNRPFLAPVQSIQHLCHLLLAEPDAVIETWRAGLAAELGPAAAALYEVVPELQALLGPLPPPPELEPREAQARLRALLVALVRHVAAPEHPLVLFFDDLQWADQPSLDLISALLEEPRLNGLLLIGAYRDNEVDAAHPLSRLLRQPTTTGDTALVLPLASLTAAHIAALLSDILHMPPDTVGSLADILYGKTGGNPFFTVELLNALYREGALRPDPEHGVWRWDAAAIFAHTASANVVEFLAAGLARLTDATTDELVAAACLGNACTLGRLAQATGLARSELAGRLTPALEHGILVTPSALALYQGDAEAPLRFCHDRMQQAVYQLRDDDWRAGLHLAMARRFAAAGGRFYAAEHYAAAGPGRIEAAERSLARELLRAAAGQAGQAGSFAVAERFLSLALDLLPPDCWHSDPEVAFGLQADQHLVLYSQSRNTEADAVFALLATHAPSPLALVEPACVQISNLANRMRYDDAIGLACTLLTQLGMPVPLTDTAQSLEAEMDLFDAHVKDGALERLSDRSALKDQRLLGVAKLMNRVGTTAYFCRPVLSRWFQMRLVRLWIEHGYCAAMLNPTGYVSCSTISTRNDYATGYAIGRIALATGQKREGATETWRTQHCFGLFTSHWREPLEEGLAHARAAFDGLYRAGSLDFACFTFRTSLAATLEICKDLGEMRDEIATAMSFTSKTGNLHAELSYITYQQLVHALEGSTASPGSFTDDAFTEDAHLAAAQGNTYAKSYYHIYRALSACIFNDANALVHHSEAAVALIKDIPGVYPTALATVLHALALVKQIGAAGETDRPPLLAQLSRHKAWLAARAADAPANFSHLATFVTAQQLDFAGKFAEALLLYEQAMRQAQGQQRAWHYALIVESAGRCHMRHGLEHAGRALLTLAHDLYGQWGALGKARALRRELPFIDVRQPGSIGSSRPNSLDDDALLRASQALAGETSLPQLVARVVTVLGQLTGATDVRLLVLNEEGQWVLEGGCRDSQSLSRLTLDVAQEHKILAASVMQLALKTAKPVVSDDAVCDSRFGSDPYFSELPLCSLLALPVSAQGRISALLILENRLFRASFTALSLEITTLLCGQLAISIENARLYQSLTHRVAQRTHELSEANRKLQHLSECDGLTGLTNRRKFDETLETEWRRALRHGLPLAVAILDVDQFKAYNDTYGHLAGDACLKSLAQVLCGAIHRAGECVARYGGEEFVVILPGLNGAQAFDTAQRIRLSIEAQRIAHVKNTASSVVTASIGVASLIPQQGELASLLMEKADTALYLAKEEGRNRVVVAK